MHKTWQGKPSSFDLQFYFTQKDKGFEPYLLFVLLIELRIPRLLLVANDLWTLKVALGLSCAALEA